MLEKEESVIVDVGLVALNKDWKALMRDEECVTSLQYLYSKREVSHLILRDNITLTSNQISLTNMNS